MLEDYLQAALADWRARDLGRALHGLDSPQATVVRREGRALLNFSSNDYLGLAAHPALREAAKEAIDRWGLGSGASRLVCGSLAPHLALEEELAARKELPAALTFSSGYVAALSALSAVLAKDSIVLLDKLCHASLLDGARLSGATMRVFGHNDLDKLEHLLRWARGRVSASQIVMIVTESVFSMDGDRAPLAEIVTLKERHGAALFLDEAHAFGVLGPRGQGLAAELGLAKQMDIHLGTLSKAVGASGGYIAGSRALVDFLLHRARGFVYSTAPPPALAAAAQAGVRLLASAEGETRRAALWGNLGALAKALDIPPPASAILPIQLGSEALAVSTSQALLERGLLVPAIRYPTVARGAARLRVTLTAEHTAEQIAALTTALADR